MKGMLRLFVALVFFVVIQCFPEQLLSQKVISDVAKELIQKRPQEVEIETYMIRRNPKTNKIEKQILRVTIPHGSPVVAKLKDLFMKASETSPIFSISTEKGMVSYFIKFNSNGGSYIGTLSQEKKFWVFEWIENFN